MKYLLNLVVLLLCLVGCGYTLQGGGSVLPPDVRRIYIPTAENSTAEAGLTLTVTEALRDEFERYGVITVVDDAAQADAILKSRIVSVKRDTRTVTSTTDTALQLDSLLTISAELRRVNGQLLWANRNISSSKSYGTTSGVVVTNSADFAAGSISSSDLGSLNSREISRGQEQMVFESLAADIAKTAYTEAVLPDF